MKFVDLAILSMVGGSGIAEAKTPLWWADGTSIATLTNINAAGENFLSDGSTTLATSLATPSTKLFTLSSGWLSSQKFALEGTYWCGNSSYTAYLSLWDATSNLQVTTSQVSTTLTTASVIRSGQFTLTPGHIYAVTPWSSATTGVAVVDASLIVFP